MHQIQCPWCGVRDEAEFQYGGDATAKRPAPDAPADAFYEFVFARGNPRGWHQEYWHHLAGCRRWIKVLRNTATHEIRATGWPDDDLAMPRQDKTGS